MFLKLAITKNIYFEEEIWLSKIANFGLEFLIDNKFSLLEMYLQQKLDHKTMLKHFFSLLAKKMFYLKKGAELDIARTERKFVNDIQFGKLGRIT
jgi:ribosome biogenesis GTPase A